MVAMAELYHMVATATIIDKHLSCFRFLCRNGMGVVPPPDTWTLSESWWRGEPSTSPSSSIAESKRALTCLACASTTGSIF
jgi:hypothetical protein